MFWTRGDSEGRKRRWLPRIRFSLRTFLVFVCIVGAALGLIAHRVRLGKERWAKITELQRLGVYFGFHDDNIDWTPEVIADMNWWQTWRAADHALDVRSAQLTRQTPAPKALELMRDFPNIQLLYIAGIDADDRVMADIVRHKAMEYLDLSKSRITDVGLSRLAEMPNLKSITLPPAMTDAGLAHVAKLPQLGLIWGSGGSITDDGAKQLAGLTGMYYLCLRDTAISDEGVRHLAGMKSLSWLDLSGTRVTGRCATFIQGMEQLQRLNLDRTEFDDSGLAGICDLQLLQRLSLAGTKVTDSGMAHLHGPHLLTIVDLSNTKVTGAGIAHLCNCNELGFLRLNGNAISDADIPAIAKVPFLYHLECKDTGITLAGEVQLLKSKVTCGPWPRF